MDKVLSTLFKRFHTGGLLVSSRSMKVMLPIVVMASWSGLAGSVAADPVSVSELASEDATTVGNNASETTGWPNPNNESWRLYFNAYDSGSDWRCYPLIKFDLSAYAGATVLGDATLRLYLFNSGDSKDVSAQIHKMNVDWTETLTPWDSKPAELPQYQPTAGTHYDSTALDISTIGTTVGYYSWTIPVSLVQGWIDGTTPNYGLFLFYKAPGSHAGNQDTVKQLRPHEYDDGNYGPFLDFDVEMPGTAGTVIIVK